MRALVGTLLLTATVLVGACSNDVSVAPPRATDLDPAARADAAQRSLDQLARALDGGSAAPGPVAPSAPHLLAELVANARALGARQVQLQYVDASLGGLTDSERSRLGQDAWVAAVQVGYRLAVDTGTTRMEVAFTFVPTAQGPAVAEIGGHTDRSALWLRGPTRIVRAGRLTVVVAGQRRATSYVRLGRHALRDVRRVLPDWHGPLVLEVPQTEDELDSVLAANPETYANIAAVTATVDGSLVPGTPIHVFVNPSVFDTLRSRGAQVVISHESTHVATAGPLADMPTWLLEGFADYVALAHAGVPVQTAAGQVLTRIRKHGLPGGLPTATELQPTAPGLGATYEEAWLACRYLAERFGEDRLVAFYQAVHHGRSTAGAFRTVLGVSEAEFVRGWRVDLARLAG